MSNLGTHREPVRNGSNGTHRLAADEPNLDFLEVDEDLRQEMLRLSAANRELLGENGSAAPKNDSDQSPLIAENSVLRRRITELEHHLNELLTAEESWIERQKEYETLLEEKSELIRDLHHKLHDLQEGPKEKKVPGQPIPKEEQLLALKEQLEQERSQLKEDEETLMTQMRQMELSMAKDRAELARQRNDLQRLHNELNREIEMAARDGSLRERLVSLQRRQQDALNSKSGPPSRPATEGHPPSVSTNTPVPDDKKSSGLFRRLFGG